MSDPKRKARAILIKQSEWAIEEVLTSVEQSAFGELRSSFRAGEASEKRDLHVARLCAIEDIRSKMSEYTNEGD